jgi:peptide/nickel transport system ATP-binding protein
MNAADTAGTTSRGPAGEAKLAPPVLEVRDFSLSYRTADGDTRAVQHVDLTLAPGEIVGLAGESGSGKSTLALGACRLLRPPAVITGGSVTYRGRRVAAPGVEVLDLTARELRALRWREIAIVFQSAMNALNPVMRVADQIGDALDAHLDLRREERRARLGELLDLVGIPRARLRAYPHELSGGMRQRVMIAMALAVDPEVVIMDEPTTALDVVVQRDILAEVAELQKRLGFAILFVTHDLSLLLEIADRIAIMYAGRLVEVGGAEQIHRHPVHPYTGGLLDSFPSVRGPRRTLVGIPGSPPDLRELAPGCPFAPRCDFARDACRSVDMRLLPVPGRDQRTACPFVTAEQIARRHPGRSAR